MNSENKKCLSEFELEAYLEGKLSSDRKESVNKHFNECGQCREEFNAINQIVIQGDDMAVEEVPEHIIKKAVGMFPEKSGLFDIILSLVRDTLEVVYYSDDINISTPSPATGLRGNTIASPEMIVLKKSFEDINVELDIEKLSGNMCNMRVTVDGLKEKIMRNTIRVELIYKGRELVSGLLEDGEAILEDISIGKYTIKICQKRKILGEIILKIQ